MNNEDALPNPIPVLSPIAKEKLDALREVLRPRDEQARLPGKGPESPSLKEGNT